MKLSELNDIIYEVAPASLAADYDNTGIMLGDPDAEVKGVLTTLDATVDAVKECEKLGYNVLLTHHPLFFKDVKSITPCNRTGKVAIEAIKNGIAVLSHHTNFDNSPVGLNALFAEIVGGKNVNLTNDGALFETSATLKELSKTIAEKFKTTLRVSGDLNKKIENAFVITGAGGRDVSSLQFAMENADVFISGEMKHNFAYDCGELALIEISHYASEKICNTAFKRILDKAKVLNAAFDVAPYVEVYESDNEA